MNPLLISTLAQTMPGLGSTFASIYNTWSQNEANEQNLQAQKDTLNWQKSAQQTTWDREDNSIQRRVADLKKAGLSPVLAAGTGASTSTPISIVTPQKQANMMPDLSTGMEKVLNLMTTKKNLDLIDLQNQNAQEILRQNKAKANTMERDDKFRKENKLLESQVGTADMVNVFKNGLKDLTPAQNGALQLMLKAFPILGSILQGLVK